MSEQTTSTTKTKDEISLEFFEAELKFVNQHMQDLEKYREVLLQNISQLKSEQENKKPPKNN